MVITILALATFLCAQNQTHPEEIFPHIFSHNFYPYFLGGIFLLDLQDKIFQFGVLNSEFRK